jgi:hypothetical protein
MQRAERLQRIHPGMKVYASDGSYVGEVLGVTHPAKRAAHTPERPEAGWIVTTRDVLGAGRFYIPFDGIADVRGNRVYLTETESGVYACGWDHPPGGQAS